MPYKFDRLEFAGSLGDLGTILPIAMGMVVINGLDPCGLFLAIGLFYIISGIYFRVTTPVQPMKVVGAYAIATGISASQITAAGAIIGLFLLVIGGLGAISFIGKYTPKPVVRGVQLSTGVLLMAQGIKFILGQSTFQTMRHAVEPFLTIQGLGPVPIGVIIGALGGFLTFLLLDNRKFPAGLIIVGVGVGLGVILGTHEGLSEAHFGITLPAILPFGFPGAADFATALLVLALPQIPMTIGNAVIANADLSREYFGEESRKVTYRALCVGMGLANLGSCLIGGMPLCFGAGGLAAHYRFGARTAGSNLMIGALFAILAVFFGEHALALLYLIPMSILGVLLLFAGGQLSLTLIDMKERKDLFISLLILGITLASNLAVGFICGIVVAYCLRSRYFSV